MHMGMRMGMHRLLEESEGSASEPRYRKLKRQMRGISYNELCAEQATTQTTTQNMVASQGKFVTTPNKGLYYPNGKNEGVMRPPMTRDLHLNGDVVTTRSSKHGANRKTAESRGGLR